MSRSKKTSERNKKEERDLLIHSDGFQRDNIIL